MIENTILPRPALGISLPVHQVEAALRQLDSLERMFLLRYVETNMARRVAQEWGMSAATQARYVNRIRKAFGGIRLSQVGDQYRVYESEKRLELNQVDAVHQEIKEICKRTLPPIELLVPMVKNQIEPEEPGNDPDLVPAAFVELADCPDLSAVRSEDLPNKRATSDEKTAFSLGNDEESRWFVL